MNVIADGYIRKGMKIIDIIYDESDELTQFVCETGSELSVAAYFVVKYIEMQEQACNNN